MANMVTVLVQHCKNEFLGVIGIVSVLWISLKCLWQWFTRSPKKIPQDWDQDAVPLSPNSNAGSEVLAVEVLTDDDEDLGGQVGEDDAIILTKKMKCIGEKK